MKLGFVGTGCQVQGIKKLQACSKMIDLLSSQFTWPEQIKFTIGLFCYENFPYEYLKSFLEKRGVKLEDINKMYIKGGHFWVILKSGKTIQLSLDELKSIARTSCKICPDFSAELADISIGSIGSPSGWSTVLIRNEVGEKIFNKALELGYIEANEITDPKSRLKVERLALKKKKESISTINKFKPIYAKKFELPPKESPSNFDKLVKSVVDADLCTLCGTCISACPANIIRMENEKLKLIGECQVGCSACFVSCPRTGLPDELKISVKEPLGKYIKCYSARAKDEKILKRSQDGGVATAILAAALDAELIDGAVVSSTEITEPWKPLPKIATNFEELLAAAGSRYSFSPNVSLVKEVKPKIFEKELFAPGHRACAGCGGVLAIRHGLKALGKNVIAVSPTGCMEVISSPYPETAWEVPWIHVAFENSAAVASGIEAALKVLGKKENINIVCFSGDGGTVDIGFQALSGAAERAHNFIYVCYDNEAYMNCLSTSSLIFTKDGLKKITEIKVGDEIYAFDQKTYQPVLKKCSGIFNNGVRDVYELETLHHSIGATSNHPFLVLKRNGRGKKNCFIWKTLSEIKIGDEIAVLKNLNGEKSFKFSFKGVKKGDYKVTHLNEVNLPEYSNPNLMKYLGVYVGDGWVGVKRGEVGFSLPEDSEKRKILIELHSELFDSKMKFDDEYIYIYSVNLAKFINSLGFGAGAKNKTIPNWIFTLPKEEKEAFVSGLILSDGYQIGNSFRHVSSSFDLLRRLRLLLQTIGYRVGKIHKQKKKKGTKCVGRELLKDSEYGYVCFSKRKEWNTKKYPSQYKYQNLLIGNEHFEVEKVKNIKLTGKEPTLDLRVEDEHNFIADGIVVHNTGIQRSGATPYGARTTTSPPGKFSIGNERPKKDMVMIMAAHEVPYVATACTSYPYDLAEKMIKASKTKGLSYIHILAPCPVGWGFPAEKTVELGRLAVETGMWPLYEVENGKLRITYWPAQKKPVKQYLIAQSRFKHLPKEEIEKIQKMIDEKLAEIESYAKS